MFISEIFDLTILIIKHPFDIIQQFSKKPPLKQLIIFSLIVWFSLSAYFFSYFNVENTLDIILKYTFNSLLIFIAFISFLAIFALVLNFNSMLLFGNSNFKNFFITIFYLFLTVLVFLGLPLHFISYIIPTDFINQFILVSRIIILIYFIFLTLISISYNFNLGLIKSIISFLAFFMYIIFFILSVKYISQTFNMPLY